MECSLLVFSISIITAPHYQAALELVVQPEQIIALHTPISVHLVGSRSSNSLTHNEDTNRRWFSFNSSIVVWLRTDPSEVHYRQRLDPSLTIGSRINLPCGSVTVAGSYWISLESSDGVSRFSSIQSKPFAVKWPPVLIRLPNRVTSRSEPVVAHIRVVVSVCKPLSHLPAITARLYRVSSSDTNDTCWRPFSTVAASFSQLVPHVLTRPYDLRVPCDRLERPGILQLFLIVGNVSGMERFVQKQHKVMACSNLLHVKANPQLELHVRGEHGASVFPCNTGVQVYYTRPSCSTARDSVRVYALLHAPVSTATPPVTRHYMGERVLTSNRSALTLPCGLFRQRFFSYCFTYTSVGAAGSTSVLASQCIRTRLRPVGRDGGFGPWTQWSPCKPDCGTKRIQVRHRMCDSPAPRNNGRFCSGASVESRQCNTLSCHDHGRPPIPATSPNNTIGSDRVLCQCGCRLELSNNNNRSLSFQIDGSRTVCPAAVWKLQAEQNSILHVTPEVVDLSGATFRLQIRDGWRHTDQLLLQISSEERPGAEASTVCSSGQRALVHFQLLSDFTQSVGEFSFTVMARPRPTRSTHRLTRSTVFVVSPLGGAVLLATAFVTSIVVAVTALAGYYLCLRRHVTPNSASNTSSCQSLLEVLDDESSAAAGAIAMIQLKPRLSGGADDVSGVMKAPHNRKRLPRHVRSCSVGQQLIASQTTTLSLPAGSNNSGSVPTSPTRCRYRRCSPEIGSSAAELELDYYDYDVTNASHVPGSHFAVGDSTHVTVSARAQIHALEIGGGSVSSSSRGSVSRRDQVSELTELNTTTIVATVRVEGSDGDSGETLVIDSDDSPRSVTLASRLTDTVTLTDLTYVDDSDDEISPRSNC